MHTYAMTLTLENDEDVEVTVEFDYVPWSPATFDSPAEGGYAEIDKILNEDGVDISATLSRKLMEEVEEASAVSISDTDGEPEYEYEKDDDY